jgi:hypothetical protein
MDADFSVELGNDDPVLDFPWRDPEGKLAYRDVKRHPELMSAIPEAEGFPEIREFLRIVNSPRSTVETAKCDAWASSELNPEEEIYDASHKFASYADIVFSDAYTRLSLPAHEEFTKKLVDLLRLAPDIPSVAEVCIRRCYFNGERGVQEGFYCTLYVSGYGNDEADARQNWAVGLKLVANALLQLSAGGLSA